MWKAALGTLLLGFVMQPARAWADVQVEAFDADKHVTGAYFVTFKPVRELRSMPRAGANAPTVLPFALPITEAAARRIGEAFAARIGARLGRSYTLRGSDTFMVVLRNAPDEGIDGVVARDPRVQSIRRVLQTTLASISSRVPAPRGVESTPPIASAVRGARVPKNRWGGGIFRVPAADVV
jgi:hypothetical protein